MKVPIPLPNTTKMLGLEEQTAPNGQQKYTRYPGTKEYILALTDRKTGKLATGLEFKIPNPDYISEEKTPNKPKEILKREELEKKLGMDNLSPNSDFWETKRVTLEDKTMIFDTEIAEQDLELCMLRASSKVAPSVQKIKEYPFAKYVIYDDEQEASIKEQKNSLKIEANELFAEMTPSDKRKLAKNIGRLIGDATDKTVSNIVYDFLEENPERFISQASKPKSEVNIQYEILEAIEVNALRKVDGGRIVRMVGSDDKGTQIGFDINDAVYFLSKPENQDIRLQIKKEVEAKKHSS